MKVLDWTETFGIYSKLILASVVPSIVPISMLCIMYITLCSDLSLHPSISHCICLHSLQNGHTPVVLASIYGHSDLVDVLVGQYGCSMSDEEVSADC